MKIYSLEMSGHSHRVQLMISLLGLNCKTIKVDLKSSEHKKTTFLKKNPFGQIPVLEDDGSLIYDSNAIIYYLASKYDNTNTYLPRDPFLAAQVQTWLAKSSNELANTIAAARRVAIFHNSVDHKVLINKGHELLKIMNLHLRGRNWFVGDKATIADISLYSYTSHAAEGGISLDRYKYVKAWLQRVESLRGFIPFPKIETEASKAIRPVEA